MQQNTKPPCSYLNNFVAIIKPHNRKFGAVCRRHRLLYVVFLPDYINFMLTFLLRFGILVKHLIGATTWQCVFKLTVLQMYSSWWRGAPAKGVGWVTAARVRISPSAPKIPTAFCRRDFLLVRAERFEKAVAKQRNSRWLFRRPCACRRARKRAERMNHLRHNVETKKISLAKSPNISGFFATQTAIFLCTKMQM